MRALGVCVGVALAVQAMAAGAQPAEDPSGPGSGAGSAAGSGADPGAGLGSGAGSGSGGSAAAAEAPTAASRPAGDAPAITGAIEGTVEAPDLDAPLAGATVTLVGGDATATTDDGGHFMLQARPGVVRVRADFTGFRSDERVVNVPAGATARLDFALAPVPRLHDTVVSVGSRTRRTDVTTPVPVDVISSEQLARSGRTETGRMLASLSASYSSVPQTLAGGTDHVDPASLRGLGPDQVLVLVNGKRRHHSALLNIDGTFGRGTVGTDLDAIAAGSIKRIEILRDGAASQYGSDAIAGVINIVTKDGTGLAEISSEAGITASRDGAQLKVSANDGFAIGDKGFINLTGELLQRDATNRGGTYTGPVYASDRATDDMLLAQQGLTRKDFAMRIGEAAVAAGMAAYNLELPLSDHAVLYSFGDLSHRRGESGGFYRFPVREAENVPAFYPNGFLPLIVPTLDDQAITIGVRRTGTWTIDASLTRGTSAFQLGLDNSVNASLGTASPTTFDAGTLESTETVANLDLLHPVQTQAVKSLALVLGSELRVENYQIHAGDEASYSAGSATYGSPAQPKAPGAQGFPGFQPSNEVDRTRDSIGVYGGVESELTKQVALDVGARYEHYSDFGQSVIGKVAGRVALGSGVALRGSASTGFRAPSLQQLWFSNVSTQFLPDPVTGVLAPAQVLTSNNASPVTRAFGIPKLREERATNLSGGVSWRPFENLSLTADGYFIRIRDRIVLTSEFATTNAIVADLLAPFPGVSEAQFFANAVDTDTTGLDLRGDWISVAGDGTLAITGAANLSRTEVTRVRVPGSLAQPLGADADQLRTFFFGRSAKNRLEDAVPHQQGFASVRYSIAGVSALVRADYYGRVVYKADDAANDESFGAKLLFDINFGYQATRTLYVGVGADNLFNTFPDRQTKDGNLSFGRFVYSRDVSQFGMNGGFYYAKLQLAFR